MQGVVSFTDALGVRVVDPASSETIERLVLCPELAAFETPLRERVSRLGNFRHVRFTRVRAIDVHGTDTGRGVSVSFDRTPGTRLSEPLRAADRGNLVIDVNAALQVAREVLPALAVLHDSRNVVHGAIAPERLVLTPQARVVIVDHVFASAIEKLQYPRTRLWKEFRIAVPPSAGLPRLDPRSDVGQVALAVFCLVIGRPLALREFPDGLRALLQDAKERVGTGPWRDMSPALRSWFERALPIDSRKPFTTALDAQVALEETIKRERAYSPAPSALKGFLERYTAWEAAQRANPSGTGTSATMPSAAETTRAARHARRSNLRVVRSAEEDDEADEIRRLEEELARLAREEEAAHAGSAATAQAGAARTGTDDECVNAPAGDTASLGTSAVDAGAGDRSESTDATLRVAGDSAEASAALDEEPRVIELDLDALVEAGAAPGTRATLDGAVAGGASASTASELPVAQDQPASAAVVAPAPVAIVDGASAGEGEPAAEPGAAANASAAGAFTIGAAEIAEEVAAGTVPVSSDAGAETALPGSGEDAAGGPGAALDNPVSPEGGATAGASIEADEFAHLWEAINAAAARGGDAVLPVEDAAARIDAEALALAASSVDVTPLIDEPDAARAPGAGEADAPGAERQTTTDDAEEPWGGWQLVAEVAGGADSISPVEALAEADLADERVVDEFTAPLPFDAEPEIVGPTALEPAATGLVDLAAARVAGLPALSVDAVRRVVGRMPRKGDTGAGPEPGSRRVRVRRREAGAPAPPAVAALSPNAMPVASGIAVASTTLLERAAGTSPPLRVVAAATLDELMPSAAPAALGADAMPVASGIALASATLLEQVAGTSPPLRMVPAASLEEVVPPAPAALEADATPVDAGIALLPSAGAMAAALRGTSLRFVDPSKAIDTRAAAPCPALPAPVARTPEDEPAEAIPIALEPVDELVADASSSDAAASAGSAGQLRGAREPEAVAAVGHAAGAEAANETRSAVDVRPTETPPAEIRAGSAQASDGSSRPAVERDSERSPWSRLRDKLWGRSAPPPVEEEVFVDAESFELTDGADERRPTFFVRAPAATPVPVQDANADRASSSDETASADVDATTAETPVTAGTVGPVVESRTADAAEEPATTAVAEEAVSTSDLAADLVEADATTTPVAPAEAPVAADVVGFDETVTAGAESPAVPVDVVEPVADANVAVAHLSELESAVPQAAEAHAGQAPDFVETPDEAPVAGTGVAEPRLARPPLAEPQVAESQVAESHFAEPRFGEALAPGLSVAETQAAEPDFAHAPAVAAVEPPEPAITVTVETAQTGDVSAEFVEAEAAATSVNAAETCFEPEVVETRADAPAWTNVPAAEHVDAESGDYDGDKKADPTVATAQASDVDAGLAPGVVDAAETTTPVAEAEAPVAADLLETGEAVTATPVEKTEARLEEPHAAGSPAAEFEAAQAPVTEAIERSEPATTVAVETPSTSEAAPCTVEVGETTTPVSAAEAPAGADLVEPEAAATRAAAARVPAGADVVDLVEPEETTTPVAAADAPAAADLVELEAATTPATPADTPVDTDLVEAQTTPPPSVAAAERAVALPDAEPESAERRHRGSKRSRRKLERSKKQRRWPEEHASQPGRGVSGIEAGRQPDLAPVVAHAPAPEATPAPGPTAAAAPGPAPASPPAAAASAPVEPTRSAATEAAPTVVPFVPPWRRGVEAAPPAPAEATVEGEVDAPGQPAAAAPRQVAPWLRGKTVDAPPSEVEPEETIINFDADGSPSFYASASEPPAAHRAPEAAAGAPAPRAAEVWEGSAAQHVMPFASVVEVRQTDVDHAASRKPRSEAAHPPATTVTTNTSRRIDWKRTAAASLVLVLLESAAFGAAYWYVKPKDLGYLVVKSSVPGIDVLVDGRPSGKTPASVVLPPGRHSLELRGLGVTKVLPVEITAGVQTTQAVQWPKSLRVGRLVVKSTPPGARVKIGYEDKGVTPVTIDNVPVGSTEVLIESDNGSVTSTVQIKPDQTAEVNVGIYSGWLAVFAPVEIRVFEGGKLIGTSVDGRLMMKPGTHTLQMVNPSLGIEQSRQVEITPGRVTAVSLQLPAGAIQVDAPAGTEVIVDGEPKGTMPVDSVPVAVGTREVVLRHPQIGQRRFVVTVGVKAPARVSLMAPH